MKKKLFIIMKTYIKDEVFNEIIKQYENDNFTENIINAMVNDDNNYLDKNMHKFIKMGKKYFFQKIINIMTK